MHWFDLLLHVSPAAFSTHLVPYAILTLYVLCLCTLQRCVPYAIHCACVVWNTCTVPYAYISTPHLQAHCTRHSYFLSTTALAPALAQYSTVHGSVAYEGSIACADRITRPAQHDPFSHNNSVLPPDICRPCQSRHTDCTQPATTQQHDTHGQCCNLWQTHSCIAVNTHASSPCCLLLLLPPGPPPWSC